MKTIVILVNLETVVFNFLSEFVIAALEQGNRVVIGLPKGERWQYFLDMGCELIDIPVDRRGVNPSKDLTLLVRYIKYLRKIKPDVVLTYTIKPNVYGGIACSLLGIPYIANVTGLGDSIERKGILSHIALFLYGLGIAKAHTVFFENSTNLEFMRDKKLVKNNYLLKPGSGVNLQKHIFHDYPKEDGTLTILWIARILKDKGIEEFLYSVQALKQRYPYVKFEMLGRNDSPEYSKQMKMLENQNFITYHGVTSNVNEYIAKAHAVIVPSYHEGLCNVLLEGASCGRPVLTTTVPGCKETFDEGITGMGCASKDAQALTKMIEKFILLPYTQKKAMGIAGRKKVEKEFDRSIVVQLYFQEIKRITP